MIHLSVPVIDSPAYRAIDNSDGSGAGDEDKNFLASLAETAEQALS